MHYLTDGPQSSPHTFIFAHGAGAPMDVPFMNIVARGLAERGIRVVRFEFPYMAARREGKKKSGAPDRQPVLLDAWRRAIEDHGGGAKVFIGGKSMGGRMATMVADEVGARGVICFGYPFHPPGRPEKLRTAHLENMHTPTLIVQGTGDQFGTQDEVSTYLLSEAIRVEWMPGGDHSFKTRQKGENPLPRAIDLAAAFILREEATPSTRS